MMQPLRSKSEFIDLQKKFGTDAAIAQKLKVSYRRVHQIRSALGLPPINHRKERNAQIITLYKKGEIARVIAEKFDLSMPQVFLIIRRAGAQKGMGSLAKKARK